MNIQPPPGSPPADFENSQPSALNHQPVSGGSTGSSAPPSVIHQLSTLSHQLVFPALPAETPRAYGAFMAFFQLGHGRSLAAVADHLGENPDTIKQWSRKHGWTNRIQAYNSGILHQQAQDQADRQRKKAADWAQRLESFREQEWEAAQKLLAAARCFLESFGDEDVQKMTLGQVSRALRISSDIGRLALAGAELPVSTDPVMSPIQQQLLEAVRRVYGQNAATESSSPLEPDPEPAEAGPPPSNGFHPAPSPAPTEKRTEETPRLPDDICQTGSPACPSHAGSETPNPEPAPVPVILPPAGACAVHSEPPKSQPPLPHANAPGSPQPSTPNPPGAVPSPPPAPTPLTNTEPPPPFRGIRPLHRYPHPCLM